MPEDWLSLTQDDPIRDSWATYVAGVPELRQHLQPQASDPAAADPLKTQAVAYVTERRTTIGTAFLALSLVCSLAMGSFASPLLLVSWVGMALGAALTGISIGRRRVFWSLCALLAFHVLAIPGSIIWGNGNWELTAGVVIWMAPALLLYLAHDAARVFVWLIPGLLLHAGLLIHGGLNRFVLVGDTLVPTAAPTGLANNPNLAAGFLVLGIIYLLNTPRQWLSLPLVAALLFTGSRWGLAVMVLLLAVMVLQRGISWRFLAVGAAGLAGLVLGVNIFTEGPFQAAGFGSVTAAAQSVPTDIGIRMAVPHIPSFLPSGVAEHPGLHNVPLRIAVENGILAAGIWVLITGWALRPHKQPVQQGRHAEEYNDAQDVHRWLLLSLVLLSVLDYYTWMGHLGGFWWLLIGLLTKASTTPSAIPGADKQCNDSAPSAVPPGSHGDGVAQTPDRP